MWKPWWLARLFGAASAWRAGLTDVALRFEGAEAVELHLLQIETVSVEHGLVWSSVVINTSAGPRTCRGLAHGTAVEMGSAVSARLELVREARSRWMELLDLGPAVERWWAAVVEVMGQRRWVPRRQVEQLELVRPRGDITVTQCWSDPLLSDEVATLPAGWLDALQRWATVDLLEVAAARNASFVEQEASREREFFAAVEKSPLTAEQVEACVCFEDRVRVIASAGSGKTSTMVGRVGYALRAGLAEPFEILLLAFNQKAAVELAERLDGRLGDQNSGVSSRTFHAFGLSVIGEATGSKPRVPNDVVDGGGLRRLSRVVDQLRDGDAEFRRDWDLFRLVFGKPLRELDDEDVAESWDPKHKRSGHRTLNGEVVKSWEELMIANFLYINGVRYEYERRYPQDLTDQQHGDYHPDFYYPDIDVWHEHWAVGPDGEPPESFVGYADAMKWKRGVHAQLRTDLIETTSASIRDGGGFDHLQSELVRRGVVFDENPYRPAAEAEPLKNGDLVRLMRAFISHVKGNRLGIDELKQRADRMRAGRVRPHLFLKLFAKVLNAWDAGLRAERGIDFDDMLNEATDLIRQGRWTSPYRVIMVDEMQDCSVARTAMVNALLDQDPAAQLYCVGDDWQSIYRFAGSDLTVMTRFEEWFGPGHTVALTETFRSPQSVCDAAGDFVTANPQQITKAVRSHQSEGAGPSITAISMRAPDQTGAVLMSRLEQLDQAAGGELSVALLGRYNNCRGRVEEVLHRRWVNLNVWFDTVHRAKGSEADHVVVVDLNRGGFPSAVDDDPVLQLAMPTGDDYPFAEERRLFYVALTRARRDVLLLTAAGRESPFLIELLRGNGVVMIDPGGTVQQPVICPTCKTRTMKLRTGKYGDFLSCTGFPRCRGTKKAAGPHR